LDILMSNLLIHNFVDLTQIQHRFFLHEKKKLTTDFSFLRGVTISKQNLKWEQNITNRHSFLFV